jgi:hypothetical protein
MFRVVCLYSPALVLFVWAGLVLAGFDGHLSTALGRVLLGITLAVHIRQEFHDRRR